MTKTIVNLLTSVVAGEVEGILDTYDDHPYQQAFAIPEMRQELIAYVLSYFPGSYMVMDEGMASLPHTSTLQLSEKDISTIRYKVHEGIEHVLNRHEDTISQRIPEEDDPGMAPSHWFG